MISLKEAESIHEILIDKCSLQVVRRRGHKATDKDSKQRAQGQHYNRRRVTTNPFLEGHTTG